MIFRGEKKILRSKMFKKIAVTVVLIFCSTFRVEGTWIKILSRIIFVGDNISSIFLKKASYACYECNANLVSNTKKLLLILIQFWSKNVPKKKRACADPVNTTALQYNIATCNGACLVYCNPNDNSLFFLKHFFWNMPSIIFV